jgi:hypothetical protein
MKSPMKRGHRLLRAILLPLLVVALLSTGLALLMVHIAPHAQAKQEIDPSYANGTTVYMIGPHMDTSPNPNLLAHAPELYILAYPVNLSPTCTANCAPLTLPSGYQPQCNPCFHPGLPPIFAYHDHVLTGAPGFGKNGTAGEFKGPWQIVLLMYNPAVVTAPGFAPITSDEALDAAEAQGEFLPFFGPNQYELKTGVILICPLVSPHA